jgi:hypothetical protein
MLPSFSPNLLASASDGFADWLQQQNLSLAFTTYQTNRLFCVGTGSSGSNSKFQDTDIKNSGKKLSVNR